MPIHTRVITAPQYEPVTLAEARAWCRVDDDITDQDSVIMLLIGAMREYAENLTGRAFAPRTLETRFDSFPDSGILELPFAPLLSVESVSYIDSGGSLVELAGSPTGFETDTHSEPGNLFPLFGSSWPSTAEQPGAVRVRYTAGYSSFSAIPRSLKLWMQARIATLYENREQIIVGSIVADLPRAYVDGILDGLMVRIGFA